MRPGAGRIEVEVKGDNAAEDHRLRMLFPTDLDTEVCYSDAPFDVVKRNIHPWSCGTIANLLGKSERGDHETLRFILDVRQGSDVKREKRREARSGP